MGSNLLYWRHICAVFVCCLRNFYDCWVFANAANLLNETAREPRQRTGERLEVGRTAEADVQQTKPGLSIRGRDRRLHIGLHDGCPYLMSAPAEVHPIMV